MVSALLLACALGMAGDVAAEAAKPSSADLSAYEAAKVAAGRDAEAHVKLALWCESRGLTAERTAHLTRAILLDPSNAKARGLLGFVDHEGQWLRPEEVSRAVEESPERRALFQEYLERRTQARDKADDQYKLALWCEENGLAQPMTAHLRRVVELDPTRDGAWRRLGFKKVGKSWINPEAEAAAQAARDAQAKADALWEPTLRKLKDALAGRDKQKRAEAIEELRTIDDPRAVASVWKVLARSNEANQGVAADVLGRIDGSEASRALSMLAVYSPFPDVRSSAAQLLARRDPREFAGLLAGLIRDEVKYTKKDVRGPGSRGELFIEGKEANVQRFYTPMQDPALFSPMPGDRVEVDENGRAVVLRPVGDTFLGPRFTPSAQFYEARRPQNASKASATLQEMGVPENLAGGVASRASNWTPPILPAPWGGGGGSNLQEVRQGYMAIPIEQMAREAQISAMVAQEQLAQDVRRIEARNAPIREVNDRTTAVLRNVSGADFGADAEKWMAWAVDLQGYAFRSESQSSTPPTIVQDVPLNFQSQALPAFTSEVLAYQPVHSCFAAGTMVRTLQGPRPIEEIRPGDQVLSEDTTTGAFSYKAVVTAYHNPPNETHRLNLGEESIVATGIHRFWKAGHGWVMARDVKAGDRLRTIGGTVEVVSVAKDEVQPVFNLQLADGDNFCVGGPGVIAHDNSFVEPVAEPFDGVPALADLTAPREP